jgi:hypothetical protein
MTRGSIHALTMTLIGVGFVVAAVAWMPARNGSATPQTRERAPVAALAVSAAADASEGPRGTAQEPDEEFWRALDAAEKPTFEEKYTGLDAHVLALARARVAARLEARSAAVFDALAAARATQGAQTPPGVLEFDRATQPETSALWAELTWLDAQLQPQ